MSNFRKHSSENKMKQNVNMVMCEPKIVKYWVLINFCFPCTPRDFSVDNDIFILFIAEHIRKQMHFYLTQNPILFNETLFNEVENYYVTDSVSPHQQRKER